jgi:hypothetical protein
MRIEMQVGLMETLRGFRVVIMKSVLAGDTIPIQKDESGHVPPRRASISGADTTVRGS